MVLLPFFFPFRFLLSTVLIRCVYCKPSHLTSILATRCRGYHKLILPYLYVSDLAERHLFLIFWAAQFLSLIHISEPTRPTLKSRMPSSA